MNKLIEGVSILVVNYKSVENLEEFLNSFSNLTIRNKFEILIFNNDSKEALSLLKLISNSKFDISYFEGSNIGFGKAVNFLAEKATYNKLLIANPDCKFNEHFEFDHFVGKFSQYSNNLNLGFWAPMLIDEEGNPEISFGEFPTILEVFFRTFFLHKIFKKFYINRLSIGKPYIKGKASAVPYPSGAFFMINTSLFKKMNGFDSKFFAYFEESELCSRLNSGGYLNIIDPDFKIIHFRGNRSVISINNQLYISSQYKYFNKSQTILILLFILNVTSLIIKIPEYGINVSSKLFIFNFKGLLNARNASFN